MKEALDPILQTFGERISIRSISGSTDPIYGSMVGSGVSEIEATGIIMDSTESFLFDLPGYMERRFSMEAVVPADLQISKGDYLRRISTGEEFEIVEIEKFSYEGNSIFQILGLKRR